MTLLQLSSHCARYSIYLLMITLGGILGLGGLDQPRAFAQTCIADVALAHGISQLNCTANDVDVAKVTVLNNITSCTAGESVKLRLGLEMALNAQTRYDIGIYTALDGGNGYTGMCAVDVLPTIPNPPFVNANGDNDACGDLDSAHSPLKTVQIQEVTVPCLADANGKLKVSSAVSWDNNKGTTCNSAKDVFPAGPAKCNLEASLPLTIPVLSALTVIKDTQPDNGQDFTFTATGAGLTNFTLDDDAEGTWANQRTFINLANGSYVISEDALAGWTVSQIICVNQQNQPIGTIDLNARHVTLNLQSTRATCTFVNQQQSPGKLVLKKQVTQAAGSGNPPAGFPFAFALSGGSSPQNVTLTSGGQTTFTLTAGVYGLSETISDPVSGRWTQTGVTCSDGSSPAAIDLASGETVTCTFVNEYNFKALTLTSDCPSGVFRVTNSNSYPVNYTWDVYGTALQGGGTAAPGANFAAINTSQPQNTVRLFVNGVLNNTKATRLNCVSLKISKAANPANGADFTFNLSKSTAQGSLPAQITLDEAVPDDNDGVSQHYQRTDLFPGVYTISELLPTDWVLADLFCTGERGEISDNGVSLALDYNDNVTCTFSNTLGRGNIIIQKVTDPAGASEPFLFTTSYGPQFTLTDGERNDSGPLLAGSYSFAETLPPGWTQTSVACSDGGDPAALTLSSGETITCTVTNTLQRGRIVVQKETVPTGVSQPFTFTTDYANSLRLTGGSRHTSESLLPGVYSLDEIDIPRGWTETSASCSDESDPSAITLSAGEIITCTFVNTAQPAGIALDKGVDQSSVLAGAQVTYFYTVTNQGQAPLSNLVLVDDHCTPLSYAGGDDEDTFLEADETWRYTCSSTLQRDTLNTAVVTATTPLNQKITASDKVFVDVRPRLQAQKMADPPQVPETGGTVRFTVVITNPNQEEVTLNTLADSIFGNLNGQGDCLTAQTISAHTNYTCSFSQWLAGDAFANHSNTVTATASDDELNAATATATATVAFSDVLPTVALSKNPIPLSQVEPAAPFTFTLTIYNSAAETVTISSLTDDYPLSAQCDELSGTELAPAASASCQYSVTLTLPASYTNTATVEVSDNEENAANANASATVKVLDLPASLQVAKSAAASTLPEPGGDMQFTVQITNTSLVDRITLLTLTDDIDNDGTGDTPYTAATICLATDLAPGDTTTCTFARFLIGEPGDLLTDVITVAARDDDEQPLTGVDDATVVITGLSSSLALRKTPDPATLPEPGGTVVFRIDITNTSPVDSVTINELQDSVFHDLTTSGHDNLSATTCVLPQTLTANGATYRCTFTAQLTGNAFDQHENVVVANGIDSDQEAVIGVASAQVSFTDLPAAIGVTQQADPTSLPESGGTVTYTVGIINNSPVDFVTIHQVLDDRFGDVGASCLPALPATLAPQAPITCRFARYLRDNAGASHRNTVTASGLDDDGQAVSQSANATVTFSDLPAQMVVTKTADPSRVPESGDNVLFRVVVTNTSAADPITIDQVVDDRLGNISASCTPALPTTLAPAATLHCALRRYLAGDVLTPHVNVVSVQARGDEGDILSGLARAVVNFIDQPATVTLSKLPSQASVPTSGAVVSFTVQVANTSAADSLTVTQLGDSIYDNVADPANLHLSGSNCRLPQPLARGETYTCQFAAFIQGAVGDLHHNTLTVFGVDEDSALVTASAQAHVLVAAPLVIASKSAALVRDPGDDGVASPDDLIEYTIVIQNTGNAPAQRLLFNDLADRHTQLEVGSVTTSQGVIRQGNRPGDSTVGIELGDLPTAAAITIRFRARVVASLPLGVTMLRNQATIRSDNFPTTLSDDPQTPAPQGETVTAVVAAPRLSALKTDRLATDADGDGVLTPGDTLEYRISIVNSGNQAALATLVNDTLDPNTRLVVGSVTTSQGQVTSGNQPAASAVAIDLGTVAGNGGAALITFQVTISKPLPAGVTTVANQGVISGDNFPLLLTDDPDTLAPADPTQSPLALEPVLGIFKIGTLLLDSDKSGQTSPGDTLLYNLTLSNRGNLTATQVLLQDTPDTQTTLINGSVQTTQGVIRQGNNSGDQRVVVDVSDLPAGATVSLTYHVQIKRSAQNSVSNQALITYTNPLDSAAGPRQLRSDDPQTGTAPDPTKIFLISPTTLNEVTEPGRERLFMPILRR